MQENENWNQIEKYLATEVVQSRGKVIKALSKAMVCLSIVAAIAILGLLAVNHLQTREFINYLSQYDFVSQDGEGYNYYNSGIEGDVNNGTENPEAERP